MCVLPVVLVHYLKTCYLDAYLPLYLYRTHITICELGTPLVLDSRCACKMLNEVSIIGTHLVFAHEGSPSYLVDEDVEDIQTSHSKATIPSKSRLNRVQPDETLLRSWVILLYRR